MMYVTATAQQYTTVLTQRVAITSYEFTLESLDFAPRTYLGKLTQVRDAAGI